jgi:hypothetical protein
MSPMSPWGDIFTEQLRDDIFIDQQQGDGQGLTGSLSAPSVRSTMQARDAGQTGFFGYYFSYRLPGGPMP